jgi:hypothetical protein
MPVTLDCTSAPFVRCGKNEIKFRQWRLWYQEKQTRPCWRLWWGLVESTFDGSQESGGKFCVSGFGRNLASVAVKMFLHFISVIKTFYKFCTFNVICKDNAATNRITVQHKNVLFPSTLTVATSDYATTLVRLTIFKNSVRTAKKTQHVTITKINWLTLFKEIIAVYSENNTKHINTKCRVIEC